VEITNRQLGLFHRVDSRLAKEVANGLGISFDENK
jgi:catalase